jgi:hypothetical protein
MDVGNAASLLAPPMDGGGSKNVGNIFDDPMDGGGSKNVGNIFENGRGPPTGAAVCLAFVGGFGRRSVTWRDAVDAPMDREENRIRSRAVCLIC